MSYEMQGPEVIEDLASPLSRAMAWAIDYVLAFIVIIAVWVVFVNIGLRWFFGEGISGWDPSFWLAVVQYLVSALFWHLAVAGMVVWRGQSPGKMVMRIRIVDEKHLFPNLQKAFMREVVFKLVLYTVVASVAAWPFQLMNVLFLDTELVMLVALSAGLFVCLVINPHRQALHDKATGTFVGRG